jgi:hypothetical protein
MKFSIGNSKAIGISIEGIRVRYADKNAFIAETLASHADLAKGEEEERLLKKALDKAWKEAFPDEAKAKKGKETLPGNETNEEAPE